MKTLHHLENRLRKVFPEIRTSLDPGEIPGSAHFLDCASEVDGEQRHVVVEWRPDLGFMFEATGFDLTGADTQPTQDSDLMFERLRIILGHPADAYSRVGWTFHLAWHGVAVCLPDADCKRYEFRQTFRDEGEPSLIIGHFWDETGLTVDHLNGVCGPHTKNVDEIVAWVRSLLIKPAT